MFRWIPYTFIRVVAFFIAGILLGIYSPAFLSVAYSSALLIFLATAYFLLVFFRRVSGGYFFNPGYLALSFIFVCGYLNVSLKTEIFRGTHFSSSLTPVDAYTVVISSAPQEKGQSWKAEGRVIKVSSDSWYPAEGNVLLYFKKSDFSIPFNYGDILLIKGKPLPVPPPPNPGEFDYQRYLSFRNIYHQHFLETHQVTMIGHEPPSWLMSYAIAARKWSRLTLERFTVGDQEKAIAAALVLGVTDGLDNELLNAYAATGTMHVLAVSGLHISIIYAILLFMLKPVVEKGRAPWLLAVVSLLILWAYAFITGLSPSVLRAVVMFSFLIIAKALSRDTNIYNTLAASAFCLLVYDPFLIMSVGFQLSYMAVFAIVYLQPFIYNAWQPSALVVDCVWKATCVSVAAQVGTFILGLLYFHQFPNYFLLSNLLIIPLSFAVLIGGLAVLACSVIPAIANILGYLLTGFIKLMNVIVSVIELMPYSLVEDVYITPFQALLLTGIISFIILMFQYRKFSFIYPAFLLVLVYSATTWHSYFTTLNASSIVVYKVPGHTAVDLKQGTHALFLTDTTLVKNEDQIKFHINPNRIITATEFVSLASNKEVCRETEGARLIVWNGKKVLIIDSKKFITNRPSVQFDLIVIANNSVESITSLQPWCSTTPVILDSSNSYYYSTKILEQAKALEVDVHSVAHEGAYIYRFDKQS
ncbi:ComEC/Rec2 family competence protein [Chryseosolibacter indicus]|uniref:ComEC/Rec2 family competence protein n=1 Tax=Chryseosolibacter indicus TaxID=2782351 RepID=A0ABS5VM58_9BACT|nr:ComEC/Rec2 family competence protein [Chryseosolibacter indicus]MBT1702527.1 ComEC/Rec2 family competence protein [Chryseosolibacter indicus]